MSYPQGYNVKKATRVILSGLVVPSLRTSILYLPLSWRDEVHTHDMFDLHVLNLFGLKPY